MKRLNPMFTLALLMLLVSCAQLGIPSPNTFQEKWVVTAGAVDEVVKNTTLALQAKQITPDDGQNVVTAAEAAKVGLNIARDLNKANPAAADAKLTAIKTAINALQTYLITRGTK